MNPYDEGYQALYDEKGIEDNPHPKGSKEHEQWEEGYWHADAYESGDHL